MLRNKQYEKFKELRKLSERLNVLSVKRHEKVYIPISNPYHMGWEYSLTLSEEGMRRKDAPKLLEILKIAKLDIPKFTKNVKFIKNLRKVNYKYVDFMKIGTSSRWDFNLNIDYRNMSERQFSLLKDSDKKYFSKSSFYSTKVNTVYCLGYYFPRHLLKVKLSKVYASHEGIPNSEVISEFEKLNDKLNNSHFYCSKNGYKKDYNANKDMIRNSAKRRHYKVYLSQLSKMNTSDEDEEILFRTKLKKFKK